jgi:hypothetical protein
MLEFVHEAYNRMGKDKKLLGEYPRPADILRKLQIYAMKIYYPAKSFTA